MTVIGRVRRMLRWSMERRGLWGTLRMLLRRVTLHADPGGEREPHPFDREHGVDTSGVVDAERLGAGHAHDGYMAAYVPIPPSRFHASIRRWLETPPVGDPESYAFVDLGCGKGRAVLLAAALHFREVIGVELDPELARVAAANVAIWLRAGRAPRPVRIEWGDATEFELPAGACLVYLANPFEAPVMERLLERLEERMANGGGIVDVLYQTPYEEAVFRRTPAFRLLWSVAMPMSDKDAAAETMYGRADRCSLYRLGG